MYGEIICDGCHSTPAALNNYFMSKGPDYAIMVSDALMAKGTPVGSKYLFGGNEIIIYPDGSAHLTATGGLAGSTLNINKGLRILVEEALVPLQLRSELLHHQPGQVPASGRPQGLHSGGQGRRPRGAGG